MDYGPALPPHLGADHHMTSDQPSSPAEEPSKKASVRHKTHSHKRHVVDLRSSSDQLTDESDEPRIATSKSKSKIHADKSKHKVRSRYVSSSSEEDQSSVVRHRSSKPSRAQPSVAVSDQDQPQHDPDLIIGKWLCLTFPPNTLKRWTLSGISFPSLIPGSLCLSPQPRLWVWMMKKAVKSSDLEVLPPCYHSAQLSNMPLISLNMIFRPLIYLRVNTSNLLLPLQVGQPCEEKIQELNTYFAKICITPKPPGAPMGKVPLSVLKELEHQARQNISTLNITAAFAKTSSSCNASLEKCQHSLKSTFKRVNSQIQKGANPEKAAKRGYELACEYLIFWNKTVLIQHRALTCLSKSLAHILQRELYTIGNTGLLRREAPVGATPHKTVTNRFPQVGGNRTSEAAGVVFDPTTKGEGV